MRSTGNLDYVGNGNIRQALDIYIPYNRISDKLPLIVYIHGGGWRRGSKNFAGRGMPYLRTGRYIFASINYRLLDEANILEMIYDCKAAIRYLKSNAKKYGIDKNKIGVWGSRGSFIGYDWTHLLITDTRGGYWRV